MVFTQGAAAEGEAEKNIQEHVKVMEGGAAKPKESGPVSDPKQPKVGAGAQEGGAAEPNAAAQNQAQAGDTGGDVGAPKVAVHVPHKEDDNAAAGGESHKQSDLGARGVPLGKKRPDDGQPAPQNDLAAQLKDEERNLDKEKEKIEKLEREIKEELAKQQELKKVQAEKERIEKEVQAMVEKQRLEREEREKLAREQEHEKERALKKKLAQEKAAEERRQQEIHKAENEILERAVKKKDTEVARERPAQLEGAVEARNVGKNAEGVEREDGEALKKGGRDLKEKVAAEADPREGVEDQAVETKTQPQGSHEKLRDQGEMDLKRRRRELGPKEAGGPPEETRGMPGLEPLLELGGSNLHAALEEQLLAGAMVHSRQIKQASEDKGAK